MRKNDSCIPLCIKVFLNKDKIIIMKLNSQENLLHMDIIEVSGIS